MASERFLRAVTQAFTADGTAKGVITVASTEDFKVKATVQLSSSAIAPFLAEVKAVTSWNTLEVGPASSNMDERYDLSNLLVSDGASATQPRQARRNIDPAQTERATYEEEPTVARRVILVDALGDKYDATNPLPVDATVTVPPVEVALDAFKTPPDNAMSVGTEDGTKTGTRHVQKIDSDGNLNVMNMGQLVPKVFDAIAVTYPSAVQEVYTYKNGGTGGTTIATVTVIYTDSSKNVLLSVART